MKFLIIFTALFCIHANAVEITTNEGINITADSTSADFQNGVVIYSGNVVIKQEGIEFKADIVKEYRKGKVLVRLFAKGSPTVFINKLASEGQIHHGTAETVEYISENGHVIVTNYVLTNKIGDTSTGNHGKYLLSK